MLKNSKVGFECFLPIARMSIVGWAAVGGLLVALLFEPGLQSVWAADTAASSSSSESTGKMKELSYVSESAEDYISFADSGFAVLFERPSDMKSIYAVKLFGSRYGTPKAPAEKFHVYLLDENKKVLEHILVPYSKVKRGPMKWFKFEFPAIQVPEKFYVAFWFDAESTKGVYVAKDRNITESHSYIGLPDAGYEKVKEPYDWMIRAEVSDEAGKKPTCPKVKTYGEEDTGEAEVSEISRMRTWNDASGAFSLEAELVKLEDGNVTLKKTNGKMITIALDKLSKEDQDFVKQAQANQIPYITGGKQVYETTPPKKEVEYTVTKPTYETKNEKELSLDDGTMAGKQSIAGGGHAVQFEVEGDSNYVTSVRLHGSRYGEPRAPKEDFNVWICDEQFKPIATFHFPYGSFARAAPVWKTFKVKPTKVPSKFIVCFGFNPHQTKGVYVSYDAEGSGNSSVGVPGSSEPEPFEKGDWMIRCNVENRSEKSEK